MSSPVLSPPSAHAGIIITTSIAIIVTILINFLFIKYLLPNFSVFSHVTLIITYSWRYITYLLQIFRYFFVFTFYPHAAEKFSCKHVESSYFAPPPIVKQKSKLAYGSNSWFLLYAMLAKLRISAYCLLWEFFGYIGKMCKKNLRNIPEIFERRVPDLNWW